MRCRGRERSVSGTGSSTRKPRRRTRPAASPCRGLCRSILPEQGISSDHPDRGVSRPPYRDGEQAYTLRPPDVISMALWPYGTNDQSSAILPFSFFFKPTPAYDICSLLVVVNVPV